VSNIGGSMGTKFHLSSTETETEDEVTLRLRRLLETAHLVKFLVELILVALGLVLSWRFGWLVFAIVAAVILAAYLRLWPSKDARAEKPPVHEPRDVTSTRVTGSTNGGAGSRTGVSSSRPSPNPTRSGWNSCPPTMERGNPILAIAAYNAGTETVGKWIAQPGID